MNPKVKVVYPSGPHEGEYDAYILKDMGKDVLVMWSNDSSINVVEKKLITYVDDDMLVDMYKKQSDIVEATKILQNEMNVLNNTLGELKKDFIEFKDYVMTYIEEERKNRKAMIAVVQQLKRKSVVFFGFTKKKKRKIISLVLHIERGNI